MAPTLFTIWFSVRRHRCDVLCVSTVLVCEGSKGRGCKTAQEGETILYLHDFEPAEHDLDAEQPQDVPLFRRRRSCPLAAFLYTVAADCGNSAGV